MWHQTPCCPVVVTSQYDQRYQADWSPKRLTADNPWVRLPLMLFLVVYALDCAWRSASWAKASSTESCKWLKE
jgi:hypothetical protein